MTTELADQQQQQPTSTELPDKYRNRNRTGTGTTEHKALGGGWKPELEPQNTRPLAEDICILRRASEHIWRSLHAEAASSKLQLGNVFLNCSSGEKDLNLVT